VAFATKIITTKKRKRHKKMARDFFAAKITKRAATIFDSYWNQKSFAFLVLLAAKKTLFETGEKFFRGDSRVLVA
jgi:hypothetical protein